jgi:hypothetical protein
MMLQNVVVCFAILLFSLCILFVGTTPYPNEDMLVGRTEHCC